MRARPSAPVTRSLTRFCKIVMCISLFIAHLLIVLSDTSVFHAPMSWIIPSARPHSIQSIDQPLHSNMNNTSTSSRTMQALPTNNNVTAEIIKCQSHHPHSAPGPSPSGASSSGSYRSPSSSKVIALQPPFSNSSFAWAYTFLSQNFSLSQ